ARRRSRMVQFIYGTGMVLFIMGLFAVPIYFGLLYLKGVSIVAYIVVGVVLFKLTFSVKGLRRAALVIKRHLVQNRLDKARFELRALVSRDTRRLTRPMVISATVESVAENISDSFVAPLFYFLLFGVPGAIAYRVVNTLDAIIGYHGEYEYLGKFAGRLDDVLNFIPARLTALFLVMAAFLARKDGRRSWQVALSEHTRTESPNAGWPMAAMAGALNVKLEKIGHYELGESLTALKPAAIDDTLKLMYITVALWIIACGLAGGIYLALAT
ncbi:MAG: cobalamin biosynthesis protein CobD, partial [Dehalococcoidales bacterium]|nr:cobalamin biosynthesis protein CobD [Dehalococcoidales bacterium]